MPEQYNEKQLRAMSHIELTDAMEEWIKEFAAKGATRFRMLRAERMMNRIRREYERRGL